MIFFILLLTLFPNIALTSRIVFPNEFVTRISLPSTLPSRTTSTNKQAQPPPPTSTKKQSQPPPPTSSNKETQPPPPTSTNKETQPPPPTSTNKQSQPPSPTTSENSESESGGSGKSTIINVCIGAGIAIVLWVGIIVGCCVKSKEKKKGKGKIMKKNGITSMESSESHGIPYANEIYGPGHYYANGNEAEVTYDNMEDETYENDNRYYNN